MPKRDGNNPKRRIAPPDAELAQRMRELVGRVRYGGSALHKQRPGDYEFVPPVNPRPSKSLCDDRRPVLRDEAQAMLDKGLELGMVPRHSEGDLPKYVWAVDADGEAYEAKLGEDGMTYHGYRLGTDESAMREWVLDEWRARIGR